MKINKEKIKQAAKKILLFVCNPHFLICMGIGWLITNGWSYIFVGVGTYYGIRWMTVVGAAYLTFLWFPFTPEKIVTVAIALFLLKLFFPNDKNTLGVLEDMQQKIKDEIKNRKKNKKDKKEHHNE